MKYLKTPKEVAKASLIAGAIDGKYTNREVAAKLGLSEREVKYIKRRYREIGPDAVVHGNTGRHPRNYISDEVRARIRELRQSETYRDTNFSHFHELIVEREHLDISYSSLCGLLKAAGIKSPKSHRKGRRGFSPRQPRALFGELLQTDASEYDWAGRGERWALHGYLDDATGSPLGLYFCKNECLMGYLEAFRQVLTSNGVPAALYADHCGVYFINAKKPEDWTIEEQLAGKCLEKTQFGRIADTLGCQLIPAATPQAKGRIERFWQTCQDRLSWTLRVQGVTTLEQANACLKPFMADYISRFARKPPCPQSAFVPLPKGYDLNTLLACKYERKTDTCGCFSFQNYTFQVVSKKSLARKKILFLFSEKLGFKAYYNKTLYPVKFIEHLSVDGQTHLPEVTRRLLYLCFFANVKRDHRP
jgi:transposase